MAIKALALLSGGLDSLLAVKVVQEQGIEVEGVTFITPFFGSSRAEKAARELNIPLHLLDITEEHLGILKRPKHGYGKGMNPCIDCHALMLKEAGKLMERRGASFLITGEVLEERPKSQSAWALKKVEEESRMEGRVLRPLSARLLKLTLMEKEGIVERERLLAIRGRSRRPQMELAKRYGLSEYPSPAGGCLLTDPIFAKRLRELLREGGFTLNDIDLLKVGRHFRTTKGTKIVVGRNKEENDQLELLRREGDLLLEVEGEVGPTVLVRGSIDGEVLKKAASLCARYSDAKDLLEVKVRIFTTDRRRKRILKVMPQGWEELELNRL